MRLKFALLTLIIILLLAACGPGEETPAPTAAPTQTPVPPPTQTPTLPAPLTILVLPADMDPGTSNEYQNLVYDLAQGAGMRFQVRNSLSAADLEPSLKIVIALPPDPGLAELAASAPQAQFLAVNIPGLAAGGNLSVLAGVPRPDVTAFLSGYIAALVSQANNDVRIGMLNLKDDPESQTLIAAFTNGKSYFCGTCTTSYFGPFDYEYPIIQDVPPETKTNEYPAYIDILFRYRIDVIYIHPALANPEMLEALSVSGVYFISPVSVDRSLPGMIASIQPDTINVIEQAWPDLVAGTGGKEISPPLILANINEELLSPGKQRLVYDVLARLLNGEISITSPNP